MSPLARRYPAVLLAAWRRPVGSRLVFGSSLWLSRASPLQLIGLISGVMTGVTAGAIGLIGAGAGALGFAAALAGFLFFAAFFLAGFFFFAAFFFEDFFEDFFFDAFFFDDFFFATRFFAFFAVFFFAFFAAGFFFAAFFFAAMVKLLSMLIGCLSWSSPRREVYSTTKRPVSHRTRLVRRFYALKDGIRACQG